LLLRVGSATTPSSRATRTAPLEADATRMILLARIEFIGRTTRFSRSLVPFLAEA
jgi:hypothetical protein